MNRILISLCFVFFTCNFVLGNDDWPQFLGPKGDSRADHANIPTTWNEKQNIKWKTPIKGEGFSSPVILGNQIWITAAKPDGTEFFALCLDKSNGKIIHDLKIFEEEKPRFKHSFNSYASPTAVLEKGRAYIHFGSYGTAAVDTETGDLLWKRRDLPCDHFRGPGSSPILYKNLLIIHYDGADVQYIVGLDKKTGDTIWKKDRDVKYGTDNGDIKKAYCTPTVFTIDGKDQLISPTSKATISMNPKNGDEYWRITYGEFSATARPQYEDGLFFINTGFSKAQLLAVKSGGKGDITDTHISWRTKKAIGSKPSQIVVNGLLFSAADKGGIITCINAKTGEHFWTERIGGDFTASPLYANGNVYFFDQKGNTTVVKASKDFEKIATNQLEDGFMASSAVSNNALFVRTKSAIYRIEN